MNSIDSSSLGRPLPDAVQQTAPDGYDPCTAPQLALATYLSRWHSTACHQLSASEAQSMGVGELLALGDAEDAKRWQSLTLEYTDPLGADWLRSSIAAGYESIRIEDVTCFAGAQEGMYAALHATLTRDDHAVIVTPSYQSLETIPLGICSASAVPLDPDDGWSLSLAAVAAAIRPNTRVIAINFPHNPTGALITRAAFGALVELCRHHGIWLLSDEVYRLTERDPGRRLPHAADAYERGISLNVVSKAYGLPGLRVGWIACRDRAALRRMQAIKQFLSTCNAGPSEVLANIALKAWPRILARNGAIATANLAALLAFFRGRAGLFDIVAPEGGMVAYPRYRGAEGVEAFVQRMAEAAGVVLLPASVFRSELADTPPDRFRIGFGRADFGAGLEALGAALDGKGAPRRI